MLAQHGGRLITLTGDGALVDFASAVDALRAAIAFQKSVVQANEGQPEDKQLVFRIGLRVGDMIVDGDDLYGDGVNIAARLEGEAPPGGVVVSGALGDAVAGTLEAGFVDLGGHFPQPLPAATKKGGQGRLFARPRECRLVSTFS